MGSSVCKIIPTILVLPCNICAALDHQSRFCPLSETEPICFKCGLKSHKSSDCENDFKCVNCTKEKKKDTNHSCTYYKCPCIVSEIEKRTNRYKWGNNESKGGIDLGKNNGESNA